jgi:hypothetical protein
MRCSNEDCRKVAVINGMCRRHAQEEAQEHGALSHPRPQDPPFSPIVHNETLDHAHPAKAARYQDPEAQARYENSSVIAQNNYVVQNKLSQVIEAHNRLNAHQASYQQPHPEHHAGYGHYPGYPHPYPYHNPDHEREHQPRYYYG